MGQQPIFCFQLNVNAQKDLNGHFCISIVTNVLSNQKRHGRSKSGTCDLVLGNSIFSFHLILFY